MIQKIHEGVPAVPQSLANILVHLVFSTKGRKRFLQDGIDEELYRYLAEICNAQGCHVHRIGGAEDHVHVVCSLSRTITLAKLLEELKSSSSKWIKTKGPQWSAFAWQGGYSAFSIGQSQLGNLKQYVDRQKEHHAIRSFQEELREIFKRYEISYDERYVWD